MKKIVQNSRDGIPMKPGMTVYLFDPHDNGELKTAKVVDINVLGAEVLVGNGSFCYSWKALWADKNNAEKNGPPYEIYNYNKIALNPHRAIISNPHETKAKKIKMNN